MLHLLQYLNDELEIEEYIINEQTKKIAKEVYRKGYYIPGSNRLTKRYTKSQKDLGDLKHKIAELNKIRQLKKKLKFYPFYTFNDYELTLIIQKLAKKENDIYLENARKFIKKLIVRNKRKRKETELTACFDENGYLIIEKEKDLAKVIYNIEKATSKIDEVDFSRIKKICLNSNDEKIIKDYYERKRKEKEGKVKPHIIAEFTKKLFHKRINKKKERLPIDEYLSPNNELKKDTIDKISLTDLLKLIPEEDKKSINNYTEQYQRLVTLKKLNEIKSLINDKYKHIIDELIQTNGMSNIKLFRDLQVLIESGNIEEIDKIFPKNITKEKNNIHNILITNNNNFFNDAFASFYDQNIRETTLTGLNNLITNFIQTPYKDTKCRKDEIHPIMISRDERLLRYGHGRFKLCFISISLCEENKQMLKEYYQTEDDLQIMYMLSVADVKKINEDDYYKNTYAQYKKEKEEIQRISDIFSKPFTEETLKKAIEYIDSTNNQISSEFEKNKVKSKKREN